MNPAAVIRAKRNGAALGAGDLRAFVMGFLDGRVAPYQMSAFLMAVYFRGMSRDETAALTRIMIESGEVFRFPELSGRLVDKHSTGGVGDLVSLVLAPAAAAAGVSVPMVSGRGLGHTGGTLDKLESIPGLETGLGRERFRRVLRDVGFVMGGQTASLVPADREMYALRDVTGTVESIPLIVSSILSKKVAEGIDALVLDVKCGRGAFMESEEDALRLAEELVQVGTLMEKQVVAFVTDMDQPLGNAVGNAVEVRSALECLRGGGPPGVRELVGVLGAAMVCLGAGQDWNGGAVRIAGALSSSEALDRFRRMVEAQGGDPACVDDPGLLPAAPARVPVRAARAGHVAGIDPVALGEAVVELGGGRTTVGGAVDHGVGIEKLVARGEAVEEGAVLAEVLARDESQARRIIETRLAGAFRIEADPPPARPLVRHLVTPEGSTAWKGPESWPLPGSARQ